MNNLLTPHELEILERTAKGEEVKHIAIKMHKSPNTIHAYKSKIIEALGAKNFNHSISIAYESGIFAKDKEVIRTRLIACELLNALQGMLTTRKVKEDKHKRFHFICESWDWVEIQKVIDSASFLNLKP